MKVVVVASGELAAEDAARLDGADLLIAADGGALSVDAVGRRPDLLVGDLDSVSSEFERRLADAGVGIERHSADKDASDTELAIEAALRAGATEIVVLGARGGERLDHELANVLLLADAALAGVRVRIVDRRASVQALRGGDTLELAARTGSLVSLLPIGGAAVGVTTRGLRWALDDATLELGRSRGLSNEVVSAPASVTLEQGLLLVVEQHAQGESP